MPKSKSNTRRDSPAARKNSAKRKATIKKATKNGLGKETFTLWQHASQGQVEQDRRTVAADGEGVFLRTQRAKAEAAKKKKKK